jgi:hypothetical protein
MQRSPNRRSLGAARHPLNRGGNLPRADFRPEAARAAEQPERLSEGAAPCCADFRGEFKLERRHDLASFPLMEMHRRLPGTQRPDIGLRQISLRVG